MRTAAFSMSAGRTAGFPVPVISASTEGSSVYPLSNQFKGFQNFGQQDKCYGGLPIIKWPTLLSPSAISEHATTSSTFKTIFINNPSFQTNVSQLSIENKCLPSSFQLLQPQTINIPDMTMANKDIQISPNCKEQIQELLHVENDYHPEMDFLFLIDPDTEDKVNDKLRDKTIRDLRFFHTAFFQLSLETLLTAINITDRFILKIKVKPKYVMCLVAASYALAAQLVEDKKDWPSLQYLVDLSKCGGTADDLDRMMLIVRKKLDGGALRGPTVLDFVRAFIGWDTKNNNPPSPPPGRLLTKLSVIMCSTEVYSHRLACLALALLVSEEAIPAGRVKCLMELCELTYEELTSCIELIQQTCSKFYASATVIRLKEDLNWTLSKRTMAYIVTSSAPALETVVELDAEHEKDTRSSTENDALPTPTTPVPLLQAFNNRSEKTRRRRSRAVGTSGGGANFQQTSTQGTGAGSAGRAFFTAAARPTGQLTP